MRQSVCRSLSSYLYSKPPLSIFLLSLLILSFTSLILALYCHSNTHLINNDILNWNILLTKMSDFKYCLLNQSLSVSNTSSSSSVIFSATQANIPLQFQDLTSISSSVSVVGNVSLSLLGLGYLSQENVTVKIQQTRGAREACVRVESEDEDIIRSLRNESMGQSRCVETDDESRVFTAHSARHVSHVWCSGHDQTVFSVDTHPVPAGLETFLDQEQRDVVFRHLVTTSLFLLLLTLALVTCIGVRVTRDQTRDMTLLPTTDQDQEM